MTLTINDLRPGMRLQRGSGSGRIVGTVVGQPPSRIFWDHEACPSFDSYAQPDGTLPGFERVEIETQPFQSRVAPWMLACFGLAISSDRIERNHRFLEEALELIQANGCTRDEAHQLVDYVFGRPAGELRQEIGGVMVTLAALCLAIDADMHVAGETELARVWTKVDQIRAKHAAKPKHGPLPGPTAGAAS